jgi:hypothetical protein
MKAAYCGTGTTGLTGAPLGWKARHRPRGWRRARIPTAWLTALRNHGRAGVVGADTAGILAPPCCCVARSPLAAMSFRICPILRLARSLILFAWCSASLFLACRA